MNMERRRYAQLYGPIYLGDGVTIRSGVVVHGPTALDDFTNVDARAYIDRSIFWRNGYVGEGAEVRGAVVQRGCNLKRGAVLFEGVVLGDHATVGEGAVLHPDVHVWPNKEVEAAATVKRSIIWGSQGMKSLFGRYGVTGIRTLILFKGGQPVERLVGAMRKREILARLQPHLGR